MCVIMLTWEYPSRIVGGISQFARSPVGVLESTQIFYRLLP